VILGRQQWPGLQPYIHLVVEAVNAAQPGSYLEVSLPPVPKRGDPNREVKPPGRLHRARKSVAEPWSFRFGKMFAT
jgi:hypothetical protein